MRLALVQYSRHTLSIKVAKTVDELLMLTFDFDPRTSPPRVHKVCDGACCDSIGNKAGAKLVAEIKEQTRRREFKVLRIPR